MIRGACLLLALAACNSGSSLAITSVTPAYGPLVGGTRIAIAGAGFSREPVRVLFAGREAPLATAIDDATLDVVIPPGEHPGDAELVVLDGDRNARATGVFRYSTPPAIAAVAPGDVMYTGSGTTVTVTGSGFLDEGAGEVTVLVDGQPVTDAVVAGDTQLTFTAPAGRPLARPAIEIVDTRGAAELPHAFRYIPSTRGGLLLFATFGPSFAVFYDPVDGSSVPIASIGAPFARYTAVTRDDHGDYWGIDRARRFGRIDLTAQTLEAPVQTQGWFPAVARAGGAIVAIERGSLRFGVLDASGAFSARGPNVPCCGSYGLASDGTTLYFIAQQGASIVLGTIDPSSGAQSTPITVTAWPGFHVEDMRFFGGVLYVTSRDGRLATIDPATGIATALPASLGRFMAIDIFE